MEMDRIQCLVRVNQNSNIDDLVIVKAGPDALTPAEMIVLMMKHSISDAFEGCSIQKARKVGTVERSKQDELDRLRLKYGDIVNTAFPRGRHLPVTLADVDLPEGSIDTAKHPEPVVDEVDTTPDEKPDYRAALEAAGVDIPKGDLSDDDLMALMIEHGLME